MVGLVRPFREPELQALAAEWVREAVTADEHYAADGAECFEDCPFDLGTWLRLHRADQTVVALEVRELNVDRYAGGRLVEKP